MIVLIGVLGHHREFFPCVTLAWHVYIVPPCSSNVQWLLKKLDEIAIQFCPVARQQVLRSHLILMNDGYIEEAAHSLVVRFADSMFEVIPM